MRTLISGTRLGQYEVVSPLGSGGMGDVYRARDTRLDREIAVKVLPEDFARDPDRVARFQREAKTLASLNHPHIAVIHDFQESGGVTYLVLELVEGETLAQRIARGPVPPDEAIAIGIQIADALEAAHEKSIVHRDLKPANVKITPDGVVKVLDFGLARWTQTGLDPADMSNSPTIGANPTMAGVIMGTAAYMSPEQARGKTVDQRTDIWAFGCVLYEMLTGKQTFAGEDVTDIIAAVVKGEPNWLLLPPSTPSALRLLLRRCLDKRLKERLRDVSDARILLGEAQREPDAGEFAAIVTKTLPRWVFVTIAALGAMVIALAGLALLPRAVSKANNGMVRSYVELSPGAIITAPLKNTPASYRNSWPVRTAMAFSPDGQTVVYSAVKDGASQLYRRPLDQLDAVPLDGTTGSANPFFSPDGQFVGFQAQGKLKKIPLNGGPIVDICDVPDIIAGASWTADNTIIFGDMSHSLSQVSADGGKPQPLTTLDQTRHENSHVLPRLLPGGKALLFTIRKSRRWEDADVALYVFATHKYRVLIPDGAADARYVSTGHLLYMRAGKLMAVPFDAARMQVIGSPVALLDDVMQAVYMTNNAYETFAGQFDVSTTGSLVYASGGTRPLEKRRLVWVDRHGQTTPIDVKADSVILPRISPEGQRLAVYIQSENDRGDIWVYDIARGTPIRLTNDADSAWPLWSPDGKRILFSQHFSTDEETIASVAAEGSGIPQTLLEGALAMAWAPISKQLLYSQEIENPAKASFWLLPMAGEGKPTKLVFPMNRTTSITHLEFSPDEHWLAYVSQESGKPEVYIQRFPITGAKTRISTDDGYEPAWSRDGRELFYESPSKTNKIQMWAVDIHAGSSPGIPHLLFEGDFAPTEPLRDYDVAADGRFLMVQHVESTDKPVTHFVLVQNWFDELKRRVPTSH